MLYIIFFFIFISVRGLLNCQSEFIVNTEREDTQKKARVSTLNNGNYIITYFSLGQYGAIVSQIFDKNNKAIEEEKIVNTLYNDGTQAKPDIAVLTNGDYVICFHGRTTKFNIYAKIYRENGTAAYGDEFLVNEENDQPHFECKVSSLSDGKFVICWHELEFNTFNTYHPFCKLFYPNGTAFDDKNEKIMPTENLDYHQDFPKVTGLDNGNFVVAWTSFNQDLYGAGVYFQLFYPNGTKYYDIDQMAMSTQSQIYEHYNPYITAFSNGRFGIAFVEWRLLTHPMIILQLFNSDGTKQGMDIVVSTNSSFTLETPVISTLRSGNFVILWVSRGQDSDEKGIFGQLFDEFGNKLGEEFRVNENIENNQESPSIGVNSGLNEFIVVFDSEYDGFSIDVMARICEWIEPIQSQALAEIRSWIFMGIFFIIMIITLVKIFQIFSIPTIEARWNITIQHILALIVAGIHFTAHLRIFFMNVDSNDFYDIFYIAFDTIPFVLCFAIFAVTVLTLANIFHVAVEKCKRARVEAIRKPFILILLFIIIGLSVYIFILSQQNRNTRKTIAIIGNWILLFITIIVSFIMIIFSALLTGSLALAGIPQHNDNSKRTPAKSILFYGSLFAVLLCLGSLFRALPRIENYTELFRFSFSIIDALILIFLLVFLQKTIGRATRAAGGNNPLSLVTSGNSNVSERIKCCFFFDLFISKKRDVISQIENNENNNLSQSRSVDNESHSNPVSSTSSPRASSPRASSPRASFQKKPSRVPSDFTDPNDIFHMTPSPNLKV